MKGYGVKDYWIECVECALDEAGLAATREQIEIMAGVVEGGRENISMAFPTPESPYIGEISNLKRELSIERTKIGCQQCNGRGRITYDSGFRSVNTECPRCKGEGKHTP